MAYITDDKVKKITELSTASSLIGDEKLPSQKGNNAYGLSLSRVGGFSVKGTCTTAAGTQDKVVTLTSYTGTEIPSLISVTFTNGNTYGDSTASPATYPRLIVKNSAGVTIATLNVCDSRGHTAGTGCWNAGDKMRFSIEMTSANSGLAIIENSDIRQQTSNMTIKSDGLIEEIFNYTYTDVEVTSGNIGTRGYQSTESTPQNIPHNKVVSVTGTVTYMDSSVNYQIEPFCSLGSTQINTLRFYVNLYRAVASSFTANYKVQFIVKYYK